MHCLLAIKLPNFSQIC